VIKSFQLTWLALLTIPTLCHTTETDVLLSIGGYFSSGDYGVDQETVNEKTKIYSLPVSLQVRHWPWTAKFSTSYSKFESTNPNTNSATSSEPLQRTESGLGDSVLTLSHSWLGADKQPLYSTAWLKIKIPTADERKDLGSGEFDYEPGFTVIKLGNWSPFLKLSFRWRGDSPETNYHHQWQTTVGLSHKVSTQWQLSGFVSSRQASTDQGKTNTSAYLSFRYQVNRAWGVTPYLSRGLADGSPDYAVGWIVSFRPGTEN
jgi:hypothetical protein